MALGLWSLLSAPLRLWLGIVAHPKGHQLIPVSLLPCQDLLHHE